MRRLFACIALSATALAALPAMAQHVGHREGVQATNPALATVLADKRREADRARDRWRHPAETLDFFRVKPGMTVVDYMPSGGWWTRILVPYLGEGGRYIGLNPDVRAGSERMQQMFGNTAATFPARAAEWTGVAPARVPGWNTNDLPLELDGTVDRVLVFREMHNLQRNGWTFRELAAMRRLLKPDGLLGIEQHRAKPDAPYSYTDGTKGYMREKDVIALVEAHGFELVGRSEINANPADPANHPEGVWVLPPNFRNGDRDRQRYADIGESDRMTLLFRKRP